MERIIDNEYYINCSLAHDIRTGVLVQDKNKYDDPALFGLDENFVLKAQYRYRLQQKKEYEAKLQQLYREREEWTDILRRRIRDGRDSSFATREIERLQQEIRKTNTRINFLSIPKSKARNINIQAAKQIPIDSMFDVLPNGFFVTNPLREERSPSNSLYLNRKKNTWVDYATGEYGDLLDLLMKQKKCTLIEAYNMIINCNNIS